VARAGYRGQLGGIFECPCGRSRDAWIITGSTDALRLQTAAPWLAWPLLLIQDALTIL
jgi:hypothetical protein